MYSASSAEYKIAWYENTTSAVYEPNWTANTVTSSVDGPLSIFSNDLDGDGDIDVLSAYSGDDKVAWYQNNGS